MANETNWHKHTAIGTYIVIGLTVILIGLGVLTFVSPPDPAHPMSFDFLSKSIVLPPWLALTFSIGIALLAGGLVRWRVTRAFHAETQSERQKASGELPIQGSKFPSPSTSDVRIGKPDYGMRKPNFGTGTGGVRRGPALEPLITPVEIQKRDDEIIFLKRRVAELETAPSTAPSEPLSIDGLLLSEGGGKLIAGSIDEFSITITRYENADAKGLLLTPHNNSLSAVEKTSIRVLCAQSFDSRHNDYRDGRIFNAFATTQPGAIEASSPGKPIWLVRKVTTSDSLLVGNDTGSPLKWPPNDTSSTQRWRLSLDVGAQAIPSHNRAKVLPVAQIKVTFVLAWDTIQNEFFIELPH